MKYIWAEVLTYVDICGKQSNSKVRESGSKNTTQLQEIYTQIINTNQRLWIQLLTV